MTNCSSGPSLGMDGSGTISKLTEGLITRQAYYEHVVMLALVPFMRPDLYPQHVLGPGGEADSAVESEL